MTDEHVLDLGFELLGGPVEEAPGRVGNGPVVVTHLVDDHAAQVHADLLLRHACDADLALMRLERQAPNLGDARRDETSTAGDDAEAHALPDAVRALASPEPGDDQCLVRFGDTPCRTNQQHDHHQGASDDSQDHVGQRRHRGNLMVSVAATSTVRLPCYPPLPFPQALCGIAWYVSQLTLANSQRLRTSIYSTMASSPAWVACTSPCG